MNTTTLYHESSTSKNSHGHVAEDAEVSRIEISFRSQTAPTVDCPMLNTQLLPKLKAKLVKIVRLIQKNLSNFETTTSMQCSKFVSTDGIIVMSGDRDSWEIPREKKGCFFFSLCVQYWFTFLRLGIVWPNWRSAYVLFIGK